MRREARAFANGGLAVNIDLSNTDSEMELNPDVDPTGVPQLMKPLAEI